MKGVSFPGAPNILPHGRRQSYTAAKVADQNRQVKFTAEQLKTIKKFRLAMIPFRLILALAFFSLIAGGFRRLFGHLPGQVFAVLFGCMIVVERIFQAPDAGGQRKDKGSAALLWVSFGLSYVLGMVDYYWISPHWPQWRIFNYAWYWPAAGGGLYLIGQIIRVIAIRTLGRFFTISVRVHDEHQVVQHGIYRYIRHPAYTGLWLINLGFVTLFASPLAYAAYLVFGTPGLIYRILVEEQMLVEQFGDEYRAYMRKTKRLIPFIF